MVDADEDLAALCNRMQQSDSRHCAILFCDEAEEPPPSSIPPSMAARRSPPRALH